VLPAMPCPVIRAPAHGRLGLCSQPSFYGAVCTFQCDVGYRLSDRTTLRCELGEDGATYWTPDAPRCRRKYSLPGILYRPAGRDFINNSEEVMCSSTSVSFCLLAALRKNYSTAFYKIRRKGGKCMGNGRNHINY